MSFDPETYILASAAVTEIYTPEGDPRYEEQEILPQAIDPSMGLSDPWRVPLSIKGRFSAHGSGMVSTFVDNGISVMKEFDPADIEACAAAGQYLLGNIPWPIEIPSEETEEILLEDVPVKSSDNNPFNLLAGIKVSYDCHRDDLVPNLIYHRGLGEPIRFVIENGLKGVQERASAGKALDTGLSSGLARAVIDPDSLNAAFFTELTATTIAQAIQADYI